MQTTLNATVATVSLMKTPDGAFNLTNGAGLVSELGIGSGKEVFLWDSPKRAFRAGFVSGTQWDPPFVGASSVAMGFNTQASGSSSLAMGSFAGAFADNAVAIGHIVSAEGKNSIVLGNNAGTSAVAHGSFVFGDLAEVSIGSYLQSLAPNQFLVRAAGGTTFYSNGALTAGVKLAPAGSSWSSLSDVNTKENFRDLDGDDVLARIARMPIREWNYKAQDKAIRHVGPTAQDFHAAFGLGEDPLRISTIDADGIALAAVQALEARARERHDALMRQNDALLAEIASLRERLARLETKER